MELASRNILDLAEPDSHRCTLIAYMMRDHPYLTIEVRSPQDDRVYLNFAEVTYVDSPIFWKGGDFGITTVEERQNLTRHLAETVSDDMTLYVVPRREKTVTDNAWVRILAKSMHTFFERPYFWRHDFME